MSNDPALEELKMALRAFADARHWQKFHSPKNLAMALSVESAELLEHFQWLTEEESTALTPEKRGQVEQEMADVLLYLVRIADRLDIDLLAAARNKIRINEAKYPADLVRGSARKYTEYPKDKSTIPT
ncbi:MAG: nucleotide pyrophosphohydrolase [Acidiferrobacteraceae bacterium]|jgi:NTP pyrophosphatase (non-canonical NTP hydrolase)